MSEDNKTKLTVDAVIFKDNQVLLLKRKIEPFEDAWVLPGGHVDFKEKVEDAVKREVKEELGVEVEPQGIIGVYSDPERDPRGHIVSIAFLCEKGKGEISLNEEAEEYKYFNINELPENIGFDHREIIEDSGTYA